MFFNVKSSSKKLNFMTETSVAIVVISRLWCYIKVPQVPHLYMQLRLCDFSEWVDNNFPMTSSTEVRNKTGLYKGDTSEKAVKPEIGRILC